MRLLSCFCFCSRRIKTQNIAPLHRQLRLVQAAHLLLTYARHKKDRLIPGRYGCTFVGIRCFPTPVLLGEKKKKNTETTASSHPQYVRQLVVVSVCLPRGQLKNIKQYPNSLFLKGARQRGRGGGVITKTNYTTLKNKINVFSPRFA